MFRKKRITMSASMLIGALALVSCGSVASSSEDQNATDGTQTTESWEAPDGLSGEISYYSANPQGLTDDLVAAFEEKTDVKVNVYADTTGKITARLKAEEANPQADLVYMASWDAATEQSSAGTLAPYTPEGSDQVHEGWATEEFVGRDGSALALVVNTNATDATPSDWADLTDPEYKDQVIMPDPRESGTAADLITAMVAHQGKQETWKLFDGLFENGMVVQGANGPALDTVTAGSKAVVFGGVDYSAYSARDEGEALEVIIPDSGTTVTPRPLMIMESSDNAQAAEAFADFMFSAEGQEVSAQRNMIPGREDVATQAGPQFEEIDQLATDWDEIVESSEGVTDEFVERYLD
ncbi:MAG TPA: ABC transporter substrate-binding protein [Candidatus Yaniella excrementavium]|nr:ABC transporter substrate-binding protein [Candidatus Yaniella excrementavium]